jgi:hypothetical protein
MVDEASFNNIQKSKSLWPRLYLSSHSGDEDYGCHAGEEQDKPHYHTG